MTDLAKSVFATSPMERHGEDREAAALEADRMLGRYFGILAEAAQDLSVFDRRMEGYDHAIATLEARRNELLAAKAERLAEYEGRANARLGQVRLYCEEYLRADRAKPPTTHKLPAGEIRFAKQRETTEWTVDGDDLLAIVDEALAQLPWEATRNLGVVRTKRTVDRKALADLLLDTEGRIEGMKFYQVLRITDAETGETHETPIGVPTQHPGGETTLEPLRRRVPPTHEYIVSATRREDPDDE